MWSFIDAIIESSCHRDRVGLIDFITMNLAASLIGKFWIIQPDDS
jgi:hypothetical protein